VQFGDHRVAGAGHLVEGESARAFIRPHDVRVKTTPQNGSLPATVERVVNLGWLSRVVLRLPDDQVLIAELPNDELGGVELGSIVHVDLRRAKAFRSADGEASGSDMVDVTGVVSGP
jgi:ABC-type sulfate/molybdate transport systems ATPase subunit